MENNINNNEDELRGRFKDAPWFNKPTAMKRVLVGGAGGIGSWLSLLLARAGFEPYIHDFDIIESHNIGGQLYPTKAINSYKVVALGRMIEQYAGIAVGHTTEKITKDSPTNLITISAFDNMRARKDMFNKWVTIYGNNPNAIFIDGRLLAEQLQIFCVKGNSQEDIERYRANLFEDSEIEDAPCTFKQTSHIAAMIASFMTGFLTNHITNIVEGEQLRPVPFSFEYLIGVHYFNTEE
jgi:hypothetical protein